MRVDVATSPAEAALRLSRPGGDAQCETAEELMGRKSRTYQVVKRGMDLVLGGALLVLALPVMLAAAAAVKLTSRGGVFFCQHRAGRGGKPFKMYKFRSMVKGAEDARPVLEKSNEREKPIFKIRHDPRVTRVGRFLRRSSIDELPQLINVLRGEMSLVGPRPLWVDEARRAQGKAKLRETVKPGLSCLWQICGRSELPYDTWVDLDLYYIRHRSLLLDLMIIVQTIPAVLSARGAY